MADISYLHPGGRVATTEAGLDNSVVHCLLLPMKERSVLLPNAAVAEIVPYTRPEPLADAPDWLLGTVVWREQRVPVISFEAASGGSIAAPRAVSRIAVLNTLNANPQLPYIAMLTQAIPQLRLVNGDNIRPHEGATGQHSVAAAVEFRGEVLVIADIDDLEQRVLRLQGF